MRGAIARNMIGSVYEHNPIEIEDCLPHSPGSRFTDNTFSTVAVGKALRPLRL